MNSGGSNGRRRVACVAFATLLAFGGGASLAEATEQKPITCTVPTPTSGLIGVTKDAAGNVWFVEEFVSKVARLELATCKFTEIPLPVNSDPSSITLGPDGNMWVAEPGTGMIARLPVSATKQSEVKEFAAVRPEWITSAARKARCGSPR